MMDDEDLFDDSDRMVNESLQRKRGRREAGLFNVAVFSGRQSGQESPDYRLGRKQARFPGGAASARVAEIGLRIEELEQDIGRARRTLAGQEFRRNRDEERLYQLRRTKEMLHEQRSRLTAVRSEKDEIEEALERIFNLQVENAMLEFDINEIRGRSRLMPIAGASLEDKMKNDDDDIDGLPISNDTKEEDIDGFPITKDEDIDGSPITKDEIDGRPMYALFRKEPKSESSLQKGHYFMY